MTAPALPQQAAGSSTDSPSFPRQYARTQRFTLGAPRSAAPAPDGSRVLFLRTPSGTDRRGCLWSYDAATSQERLLADPRVLLGGGDAAGGEELSREERARRERAREGGAGIVGYATDNAVTRAVFGLSGRLFLALAEGEADVRELPAAAPVVDPRLDPTGARVAYVCGGELRVLDASGSGDRALLGPTPNVTWGLAEFIAAEEMDRTRGYWWSPDGSSLLVARVDESPVQRWHISDPAEPGNAPVEVAYPAVGTPNADVSLVLAGLDGNVRAVEWDRTAFPYLAAVHWNSYGPPLLLVQSRDQRRAQVLRVDLDSEVRTQVLEELTDDAWVSLVGGVPAWTAEGARVGTVDKGETRRLCLDGVAVTPPGLEVAAVLGADERGVLFLAGPDPTRNALWNIDPDGSLRRLTDDDGRHGGRRGGELLVVSSAGLDAPGTQLRVYQDFGGVAPDLLHEVASYAADPMLRPRLELLTTGSRNLHTAVLLPRDWSGESLPVLLDPYGGPGAQRVVAAAGAYLSSQWLADQGFAVVIVDGRGTPGRGPVWEREVAFDLAAPVLEDQIDALQALAADRPYLDLSRVGIRGWSFGGYLAALAVLRRPDVFHAAIAGAPVTDWTLYDTHYTERYLGTPQEHPEAYARTSLLADAHRLARPLRLIHGLADDNVVAAHTLRLSSALLAAGRPHTVLPLSGVTHMTPQEEVAENLLLLQVAFLKQALGLDE